VSLSACASHRPPTGAGSASALEAYIAKVKAVSSAAKARPQTPVGVMAQTLESSDPRLAAALLLLAVKPTAETHRRVAMEYRRLGVLDMAHGHLTKAAELAPDDAAVFDGLARVWRDLGCPDRGFADAARAVYLAPSWPVAANTLGTLFEASGRPDAARRWYRRALEIDPHASYALNNLCYAAITASRPDAVTVCRRALAQAPDSQRVRNNLGLAYAARGELDKAREQFDASVDAQAGPYNMGIVYLSRRQFKKATESFDAAVRINPGFALAAERARQARLAAANEATDEAEDHDRH
jgi:tetratricopeptide (TPR) repeat protein